MRGEVLCCVLIGVIGLTIASSERWWSLGFNSCATDYGNCTNCEDTNVFNSNQESLCKTHGENEVVRAMSRGILECIRDCQRKFSNTQWNCTTFNGDHLFGRFIDTNTRETAMLNAFLSAGAVHGIASACHEGTIDGCPCIADLSRREGGVTYVQKCNDNVGWAIRFIKNFYNMDKSVDEEDLVNGWNNQLGYEAVDNRTTCCRCTGLSGSCVVQTCYERAPSADEIGNKIRVKYEGSQKVEKCNNNSLCLAGNPDLAPIPNFPVHLNVTPDLCAQSLPNGILGTVGRKCDPNGSGSNSCNNLCCGRGFEQVEYTVTNEECKFEWCCRIVCTAISTDTIREYRCL